MALPSPDHPSFNSRAARFGIPPLPAPGVSVLREAIATGESSTLVRLAAAVGGADALEGLHAEPWSPDGPDWHGVPDTGRDRALEVLALVTAKAGPWLDDEMLTIVRRLVVRAARLAPDALAKGPAPRTAAACVWLAVVGNALTTRDRVLRPGEIWSSFGVGNGAARGRALYGVLGLAPALPVDWLAPAAASVWPADPLVLRARTRATLCRWRDGALRTVLTQREQAPISAVEGGRIQLRARPLVPEWATRGTLDTGRDFVAVTFDDGTGQPFVVGLSVPDARHLVRILGDALDAPCRSRR